MIAHPHLTFPHRFRINLVGCCVRLLIGSMGQFSIQPIIRLVVVGIVLLSEQILSENAVVGSWAQLLAVRLTIPRRKLEKVPYCVL